MAYNIQDLLSEMVQRGASDLHITAGAPPLIRLSGKLTPIGEDKLKPDDDLIAEIGRALVKLGKTEAWQRGIGKPYASTFLNGRKWEDADEIYIENTDSGGWAEDTEVI